MRTLIIGLVLCECGYPALVVDAATGTSLAGATVTVTRFGGAMSSATFASDGAGGAIASTSGSGGFTLTVSPGDTAAATWTLENTDPAIIFLNSITTVKIDLTLSVFALFDDGTAPSTPDSGPGVAGVAGAGIASSGELTAWTDPANTGDMFRAVTIVFSTGLGAGATSSWTDDTDVIADVPEPSSGLLFALAAGALAWRRRGRAGL